MHVVNSVKNGKTVEFGYNSSDSMYCYVYGQYKNGLEEGLWTKTDTSGTLFVEMTYVNGKRLGYFTNYFKNGKLRLKGELEIDGSMKNFKFFEVKERQRLLQMPVAQMWLVATILTNVINCKYGCQTSRFFGVRAPTVEQYLRQYE